MYDSALAALNKFWWANQQLCYDNLLQWQVNHWTLWHAMADAYWNSEEDNELLIAARRKAALLWQDQPFDAAAFCAACLQAFCLREHHRSVLEQRQLAQYGG